MKMHYCMIAALIIFVGNVYGDAANPTPIGLAIMESDLKEVQNLINSGQASVKDSADNDYFAPLLNQAIFDYKFKKNSNDAKKDDALAIIKFLLEKDAPLNAYNENKLAPLHEAVLENLPEIVILLLKKGANINIQGGSYTKWKNGQEIRSPRFPAKETPLFMATERNFSEIVKILLAHGAHIKLKNSDDATSYDLTIIHTDPTQDYVLIVSYDPTTGNEEKVTPQDRSAIKKMLEEHEINQIGLQKTVKQKEIPFKDVEFKFLHEQQ